MTLGTLLAVAAMILTDPTGDAAGDGTLTAPSAPIYANASIFDLQEVEIEGDDTGATLRVTMGSLENASSLPEGFSGVIVDVYVDTEPGGATVTLPGPDMHMPPGRGWQFAVRISGDGAYAVRYAEMTEGADALTPDQPASVGNAGAAQPGAEPAAEPEAALGELGRVPLAILRDGSTVSVRIPWPVGEHPEVYAMSGVYDPFTPTGWRPLAAAPSPWAFSGADQAVPVVDVLAPDADAQGSALRSAVLPRMRTRSALASPWLLVMAVGLALAALGLWLRRKVAPDAAVEAPERAPDAAQEGAAPVPEAEATPTPAPAPEADATPTPAPVPRPVAPVEEAARAEPSATAEPSVTAEAAEPTPEAPPDRAAEPGRTEGASAAPPSGSVALALRSDVRPDGADSGVADASPPEPAVGSAAPDMGPPERDAPRHDPFAAFGAGDDDRDDESEAAYSDGFARRTRPRAAPAFGPIDLEENGAESAASQDAAVPGVVENEPPSTDGPPATDRDRS